MEYSVHLANTIESTKSTKSIMLFLCAGYLSVCVYSSGSLFEMKDDCIFDLCELWRSLELNEKE